MKYKKCPRCGHYTKTFSYPHSDRRYIASGYSYGIEIHPYFGLLCFKCIEDMHNKIAKVLYETPYQSPEN